MLAGRSACWASWRYSMIGPHCALVSLACVDLGLVGPGHEANAGVVSIQDLSGKSFSLSGLNPDWASSKERSFRKGAADERDLFSDQPCPDTSHPDGWRRGPATCCPGHPALAAEPQRHRQRC